MSSQALYVTEFLSHVSHFLSSIESQFCKIIPVVDKYTMCSHAQVYKVGRLKAAPPPFEKKIGYFGENICHFRVYLLKFLGKRSYVVMCAIFIVYIERTVYLSNTLVLRTSGKKLWRHADSVIQYVGFRWDDISSLISWTYSTRKSMTSVSVLTLESRIHSSNIDAKTERKGRPHNFYYF